MSSAVSEAFSSIRSFFLRIPLHWKINLVGAFIILMFTGIVFFFILPLLEEGKLEERRGKLRAVVNSVVSHMDHYERHLRASSMSWSVDKSLPTNMDEAKKQVIRDLREMRYDKTEYFFILDGNGNVIMHPIKPDLEGTNVMDLKAPDGTYVFRDLVLNSQRDDETFVSYIWKSKYSETVYEPQTTYAKYYWPWDWVVCSGVYTQDIVDSVREIAIVTGIYDVVTAGIAMLFLFFVGGAISSFEENHKRKLRTTLDQVQALKDQQDGDYFLTSLLIQPLGGARDLSERVPVDIYVAQKKRFVFKDWASEIGGDLCGARRIVLRGKVYTVFLNGDAMGKSMQGAGGALVLGTVFKAHITRTQLSSQAQDRTPEQWLRECFIELHNVFVSFDGTMLVSAVFGLIDESNGFLYFINAEHPFVSLYRKGSARFIEEETNIRKLGWPGIEGNFRIQTFQMEHGDSIIVGSDGKDDLIVGNPDGLDPVVRSVEQDFLVRVEDGLGDLERIAQLVRASGTLIDDLSMLKATYMGSRPTETEIQSGQDAFDVALQSGNDSEILNASLHLYELTPENENALYMIAKSYLRLRKFKEAADAGEGLRVRNPQFFKVLLILAETYRHLGNRSRSQEMLERFLKAEPENPHGLRLKSLLDELTEGVGRP